MIGVVIATHGHLASSFLEVAEDILGEQEAVAAVGVLPRDGAKEIKTHLIEAVDDVQRADGVLILTGIFGESDCQMSRILFAGQRIRIVTGLNLPMLLKVLTHRSELNLEDLVACACEGGRSGILDAS
jgi:mannose PTS system EIIA component